MRHRLRAPSPSLVVSLIALFVALGGTSYAAIHLPKNSVGTRQLKKNAVTDKKLKNHAVTAAKIDTKGLTVPAAQHAKSADSASTATHATSADSAANATNAGELQGHDASDFASSSVVRYVTLDADGTVVASASSGVSQSNISHPSAGEYCIDGLSPAPKTATASARFAADHGLDIFVEPAPAGADDCSGSQIGVSTYNVATLLTNEPIVVALYS